MHIRCSGEYLARMLAGMGNVFATGESNSAL
jgi:hypothetical protein